MSKYNQLSQLDIATDDEILASWTRMQHRSRTCNKTEFKQWSQACGIDYTDHALLLSDVLRRQNLLKPMTHYMPDFMHALCSNGVFQWVTFLLIQALSKSGLPDVWKKLQAFVQLWTEPAVHKCALHKFFEQKAVAKHKEAGKLKCAASEMLSLYKVLAYYVAICCLPVGFATLECLLFDLVQSLRLLLVYPCFGATRSQTIAISGRSCIVSHCFGRLGW